jgi:hypothetical protein
MDLTAKLEQAIKIYEVGWKPVDDELYDLCRRRASHRDYSDVYTKVTMIGRIYEAGISRAFRGSGNAEVVVARELVAQSGLLEEQLVALTGRQFDRQIALEIVELHGRITGSLATSTGNVWLTSFVSKYLHFHCPVVPIYDSNAAGSIGRLVGRGPAASIRDSMVNLKEWATAYRNFVAAFVVLYERAWAETSLKPSVKEVDYLLWQT